MGKTVFTPRKELICGKLDELHVAIIAGDQTVALDLVSAVRRDAERMEAGLVRSKDRRTTAETRADKAEAALVALTTAYLQYRDSLDVRTYIGIANRELSCALDAANTLVREIRARTATERR